MTASGRNLRAARATIRALRADGRVGDLDRARVETFLALAAAVDAHPGNANLWHQYRMAERSLRVEETAGESAADGLAGLLDRLRGPVDGAAEVRDASAT